MSLTSEACARFVKLAQFDPTPDMQLIPDDIIGLGYNWYPIVICSKNKETLDQVLSQMKCIIRPCINTFRGSDMTKEASYSEDKIIEEVIRDSINVGCRPMGYHLGIAPRFFDPKEITDAIEAVKTMPNSHFVGFMPAFDLIEFALEDETLYLNQENCIRGGKTKTKSWIVNPKLEARDRKDSRIFNWLFRIEVDKRPPTKPKRT